MRRTLLSVAAVIMAAFIMAIGGVDNVARSQSPPPAPNAVSAVNGANLGSVVVSWEAVAGAAFYRIGWIAIEDYLAAQAAGSDWQEHFRYFDIGNRGQTSHTITRLTPGIDYLFIIGSNDTRYGSPQWSTLARLTLAAAPTPSQPGGQPVPDGTQLPSSTFSSSASKYQAVDAGKNHTCGIKLDNTIECWGDNTQGQTDAPAGQFLSVSAGGVYSCGIDFENQPACWGHAAIPAPPVGDYTHVSAGDEHACAITVAVTTNTGLFAGACPTTTGEPLISKRQVLHGMALPRGPTSTVRFFQTGGGERIAGATAQKITPLIRVTPTTDTGLYCTSARSASTSADCTMMVPFYVAATTCMGRRLVCHQPKTKAPRMISTPTAG